MGPRSQFVCQSPACRRQFWIAIPTGSKREQISNRRCACGSEMKRVYFKPVFRELCKAESTMGLENSEIS